MIKFNEYIKENVETGNFLFFGRNGYSIIKAKDFNPDGDGRIVKIYDYNKVKFYDYAYLDNIKPIENKEQITYKAFNKNNSIIDIIYNISSKTYSVDNIHNYNPICSKDKDKKTLAFVSHQILIDQKTDTTNINNKDINTNSGTTVNNSDNNIEDLKFLSNWINKLSSNL